MNEDSPVLVTTDARGIFFGYLVDDSKAPDRLSLRNARNVVWYDDSVRGVFSLAEDGPTNTCRVSAEVAELELFGITSIASCSEKAVAAFDEAPWVLKIR